MFVLNFNATHYFQVKSYLFIYFLIIFLNNTRKYRAPFMEILFSSIINSSMERSSYVTPSPDPPSTRKSPPENFCTSPNNHYYM